MSTTIAQVAQVVGQASSDATFRTQLVSDPVTTLKSAGIDVSNDVQVLENTSSVVYLVVPPRPSGVADADLQRSGDAPSGGSSTASNLDALGALFIDAWADSNLKSRLLQDPGSVLAERGISIPGNATVRAVEATDDLSYLVLPPASTGGAA